MAELFVSKIAAAQRQLDAAIRCLFRGEDLLAVYTLGSAASGILEDMHSDRGRTLMSDLHGSAFKTLYESLLNRSPSTDELRKGATELRAWLKKEQRRPANFLKHANRDPEGLLNAETVKVDALLLQACCFYADLGLDLTVEMQAFCRWHLATHPSADGDELQTGAGAVHMLQREEQLEAGAFLLKVYQDDDPDHQD